MDTPRNTAQETPAPNGSVTGVARGGLGTAANLEDTQVLLTSDLQAAAKEVERAPVQGPTAAPEREVAPPPVAPQPRPAVKPVPVAVPATPPVAAASAPASAGVASAAGPPPDQSAPVRRVPTVQPVGARHPSAAQPGRGLAGVLAAAFLVLAGVAFVVSRGDGTIDAGGSVPGATAPATADPVVTERPEEDNDGDGKGKGKGNGNGKGRGNGGDNKPD